MFTPIWMTQHVAHTIVVQAQNPQTLGWAPLAETGKTIQCTGSVGPPAPEEEGGAPAGAQGPGLNEAAAAPASVSTLLPGWTYKSYYYADTRLIAMRVETSASNTVYYLHSDHLGSASLTTDSTGAPYTRQSYYPYGQPRSTPSPSMPTDIGFTGQRADTYINLLQMGTRWYDPAIGRWISPDSIIPQPGNPQALSRYTYGFNNPIRYTDPSGHWSEDQLKAALGDDWYNIYFGNSGIFKDRQNLLDFLLSDQTTDAFTLSLIGGMFFTAHLLSGIGVSFRDVDAIGQRGTVTGGLGLYGGGSLDFILNLKQGQFSAFLSPEVGVMAGQSATAIGGFELIKNLPSNDVFRGATDNIGFMFGYPGSLNGEANIGAPMHDDFKPTEKDTAVFIGGGPGEAAAVYTGISYGIEALRVDASGYRWRPDPRFSLSPANLWSIVSESAQAAFHDYVQNPFWPWSPYR